MQNRVFTIGLIAIVVVFGYIAISNVGEDVASEAQVISSTLQIRQIETALELYYLSEGRYPAGPDNEVVSQLYEAGALSFDTISTRLDYTVQNGGSQYSLQVK